MLKRARWLLAALAIAAVALTACTGGAQTPLAGTPTTGGTQTPLAGTPTTGGTRTPLAGTPTTGGTQTPLAGTPTTGGTQTPLVGETPTEEGQTGVGGEGAPALNVSDQSIEGGMVTIDQVVINEEGWVVVGTCTAGKIDQVLGETMVDPGVTENVTVDVGTNVTEGTLCVALYNDVGQVGVFEEGTDQSLDVVQEFAVLGTTGATRQGY